MEQGHYDIFKFNPLQSHTNTGHKTASQKQNKTKQNNTLTNKTSYTHLRKAESYIL